jgi:hypothetical protein
MEFDGQIARQGVICPSNTLKNFDKPSTFLVKSIKMGI